MAGLLNINSGKIAPSNGQIFDLQFSHGFLILKWSGSTSVYVVAVSDDTIDAVIRNLNLFGIGPDAGKIINVYKESPDGHIKIKYLYDTDGYEINWVFIGF